MVYRPTANTEARKVKVRERLLKSGLELVAEGGFKKATIGAVAKRAGVASGTVYSYFNSKTHLSTEIFQLGTEREVAKVHEALTQEGDITTRLENATRVFMTRAMKGRTLAFAMIAEAVDEELDDERRRYREVWAHTYEPILQEGIDTGYLPPQSAAITAAGLVGSMAEVMVGPLSSKTEQFEDTELVDTMVAFCLRAVGLCAQATNPAPTC
ncbi:TetR/AcrR family transcriptional regulator [Maricurvus nonylphenolicus]|uniref:TetR/AcrR family transcriptional regulator n=1 Tax=Maricurvus nonylphenolicus TaxID=1008307 RepID=UPI0036F1D82D